MPDWIRSNIFRHKPPRCLSPCPGCWFFTLVDLVIAIVFAMACCLFAFAYVHDRRICCCRCGAPGGGARGRQGGMMAHADPLANVSSRMQVILVVSLFANLANHDRHNLYINHTNDIVVPRYASSDSRSWVAPQSPLITRIIQSLQLYFPYDQHPNHNNHTNHVSVVVTMLIIRVIRAILPILIVLTILIVLIRPFL